MCRMDLGRCLNGVKLNGRQELADWALLMCRVINQVAGGVMISSGSVLDRKVKVERCKQQSLHKNRQHQGR